MTTAKVRADFDRIASLAGEDSWGHNEHYHPFLLRHLPTPCRAALDIGCGTGQFSRLLATRTEQVTGVDLSPRMIEVARDRAQGHPNITFQVADVTTWLFPDEAFDCVASIATLHHLPLAKMLQKMKRTLTVGGTLLVLDLYEAVSWSDRLLELLAVPTHTAFKVLKSRHIRESQAVQEAWAEHGKDDVYPTLAAVRRVCAEVLPGAQVRRHLLWRYSIIWHKV